MRVARIALAAAVIFAVARQAIPCEILPSIPTTPANPDPRVGVRGGVVGTGYQSIFDPTFQDLFPCNIEGNDVFCANYSVPDSDEEEYIEPMEIFSLDFQQGKLGGGLFTFSADGFSAFEEVSDFDTLAMINNTTFRLSNGGITLLSSWDEGGFLSCGGEPCRNLTFVSNFDGTVSSRAVNGVSTVPEPLTLTLLAMGTVTVGARSYYRKRRS